MECTPEGAQVLPLESHLICSMPVTDGCRLVMVDETSRDAAEGLRHALVAIVLPPERERPPELSATWHSAKRPWKSRSNALSRLLATPTGIFGVIAPGKSAEDWAAGMVRLTELVSVLLPGDSAISFSVEEQPAALLGRNRPWRCHSASSPCDP